MTYFTLITKRYKNDEIISSEKHVFEKDVFGNPFTFERVHEVFKDDIANFKQYNSDFKRCETFEDSFYRNPASKELTRRQLVYYAYDENFNSIISIEFVVYFDFSE